MVKNVSNLKKKKPPISYRFKNQKKNPKQDTNKDYTPKHIMVKLLKNKDKENIMKALGVKLYITYREKQFR